MRRAPGPNSSFFASPSTALRRDSSSTWQLLLWTLVLCVGSVACEDQKAPRRGDDESNETQLLACVDEDGDGYGRSCDKGRDCDDSDPEVTNDCDLANCDKTPTAPGCKCDEAGAVIECGEQHATIDDRSLCGYGVQLCDEGRWSGCRLSALKPTKTLSALASPSDCDANPCDPFCKEFTTEPAFTADMVSVACDPDPSCVDGIRNQGEIGIDCGGECAKACSAYITLINEDFTGSLVVYYEDDHFGATTAPGAASGVAEADKGKIFLGEQVTGAPSSGAWIAKFTADAAVNVSFDWTVELGPGFLGSECGEANTSLDGVTYATAVDWVAEQCGPGSQSGSFSFTSGALTSGEHTLVVGGWLSGNTSTAVTTSLAVEDYTAYSNPVASGSDAGRGGDLGFGTCTNSGECQYYQGDVTAGDTIEWEYDAPSTGDYTVGLRLAALGSWTANIKVDGTTVDTLSGGYTGGAQSFTTVASGAIAMTAGTHTVQVYYTSGTPRLNRIEVTAPATGPVATVTIDNIRVTATNTESCGDAVCNGAENCTNCASDCGDCPIGGYCGDAICEAGETCSSCETDCGTCVSATCGDALCTGGETCSSCASDCGECTSGDCGNAVCGAGEDCTNCATDCGTCSCGDAACTTGETCSNCAIDCGACAICGDAVCGSGETCTNCATDCGGCPVATTASLVYLEAECGTTKAGGYATPVGTNPKYVVSVNNSTSVPGTDRATFDVGLNAGTYTVYFLVDTDADANNDSWYWRFPAINATWTMQNNHTTSANFIWVAGAATVNIGTTGTYTLEIGNREDGLKIDQIALVRSGQATPSGGTPGAATNCSMSSGMASTCGNAACDSGETCSTCAKDCGACARCGDATCGSGEDCTSCAADCGSCMSAVSCGDAVCDMSEDCGSCATDCGACPTCGDAACEGAEDCGSCAIDCGACSSSARCGDSTCDATEDCGSCALDCTPCPLPGACGDSTCDSGESCATCAVDCGVCGASVCGDSVCDGDETCDTCASDCSYCIPMCDPPPVTCGDATCDATSSEDCDSCPADCGSCDPPATCGNGTCNADTGEDCSVCPADCGSCNIRECGDGLCEPSIGESCTSCEADCDPCEAVPTTVCGDTICSIYENCDTCPADCGACPFWGSGDPFNGGILSTGTITVSQRVTVNGDISGKNFSFGSDSIINGDVDIDGNVYIDHRVKINGTLRVEGTISAQGTYTTTAQEHPAAVSVPTVPTITVSAGTTPVTLNSNGSITLAPGSYGAVSIGSFATVNLSAGTYHFASLTISPDAIFNLNLSGGPIDIRVAGNVEIESRVKFNLSGGNATQIGLYSTGNVILRPQNTFPGSIYAPNGKVTVYSNSNIRGIAAKDVDIQPDISVGLGDLNTGWEQPAPPSSPAAPVCGDAECTPETGESCSGCGVDCGSCDVLPTCGDASCNTGQAENCRSCDADCGPCGALTSCGDGLCDTAQAESCDSCASDCGVCPPPPGSEPISIYTTTEHSEDFDISTECAFDQAVIWAGYSWEALTPSDSRVEIYFRSADTEAGLDTAPEVKIVVAASSAGAGGWQYGPPAATGAMTVGLQYVDTALKAEELPRHQAFARLRYKLVPSADGSQAPELLTTALQSSCEVVQ